MEFNAYQIAAYQTLNHQADPLILGALGLAGEAGEVVDLIKKHLYHGHTLDKNKLIKELGDVLYYLATIATSQEIEFNEVPTENIIKLKLRYGDAFSVEKSRNRKEGDD